MPRCGWPQRRTLQPQFGGLCAKIRDTVITFEYEVRRWRSLRRELGHREYLYLV